MKTQTTNDKTIKNLNVKLENIDTKILKLSKRRKEMSNVDFSKALTSLNDQAESVKDEILTIQLFG